MQHLVPVPLKEREIFMDVLRGFAILGIFIANLNGFSWYSEALVIDSPFRLPEWDHKILFLQHMFVEGKFYSIFSLLFGWGIALQIKRAADKGLNALPTVRRRLFFMLMLGAIHLMLWPGDIVFFYALLGFVLLPFRKLYNKALLICGIVLVLSPIAIYAAKSHWLWLNAPVGILNETAGKLDKQLFNQNFDSNEAISQYLATATWGEAIKANISGFFYRYSYLFFVSRVPKVLGLFLIGYALGRSGFYTNIQQHKKTLYGIIAAGIIIGLPANYFLAKYMLHHMGDYWQLKTNGLYQTIFYALGVVPLSFLYVAVFMLSFQNAKAKNIMKVFAPVGKMAFSNYIFQTLVGSFVFLGAGLGYINKVGPVCYIIFGLIVFSLQVLLSHLWLSRFNYGPVEWLWRSATYSKWQPMRKQLIVEDNVR